MQKLFFAAVVFINFSEHAHGTCASINDSKAMVCMDFENGTQGQNGSLLPLDTANAVISSPGLNGSQYRLHLHSDHISSSCPEGEGTGVKVELATGFAVANGEVYFIEWTEYFDPDYRWRFGCDPARGWTGNSNHKDIDLRFASSDSGQNRILFAPADGGENGYYMYPLWAIYSSDAPVNYVQNQNLSYRIKAGDMVHFVVEIKSASGLNGHFKMWANNILIMDYQALQTCRSSTGCSLNAVDFGGPQSNTGDTGNDWYYDDFRITRTNIAPAPSPTPTVDSTPPAVTITSPANGAIVKTKTLVAISASARDNLAVAKVEIFVNGSF
jgi:hypothetical protein